jgi:hypothetical protein
MFKIDDLVIMTEYGVLKLIVRSNPHYKKIKSTLFKVTFICSNEKIEVDRINGTPFPSSLPAVYFRLATPMEVKLLTMKNIFI